MSNQGCSHPISRILGCGKQPYRYSNGGFGDIRGVVSINELVRASQSTLKLWWRIGSMSVTENAFPEMILLLLVLLILLAACTCWGAASMNIVLSQAPAVSGVDAVSPCCGSSFSRFFDDRSRVRGAFSGTMFQWYWERERLAESQARPRRGTLPLATVNRLSSTQFAVFRRPQVVERRND